MGCRDVVHRRPWGVVGIIGTWNYPVFLNVGPGRAGARRRATRCVWKPSENVPRTADLTHALFLDAGFPPDLFHMLPATREAGPQLAEADVDHVVFTGSDAVGRKLAARLGERLVPSTLELSGCDAMFVLADADVETGGAGRVVRRDAQPRADVHRGAADLRAAVDGTPRSPRRCASSRRTRSRCRW